MGVWPQSLANTRRSTPTGAARSPRVPASRLLCAGFALAALSSSTFARAEPGAGESAPPALWLLGAAALAAAGVAAWLALRGRGFGSGSARPPADLLREVADQNPVPSLLLRGGRIAFASAGAARLLARSPAELVGMAPGALWAPWTAEGFEACLAPRSGEAGGVRAAEGELLRADGSAVRVRLSARPADQDPGTTLLYLEDLTGRPPSGGAAQDPEDWRRLWAEHGKDAFYVHDPDGRVLRFIAPEGCGIQASKAVGRLLGELYPEDQAAQILARIRRVAETGQPLVTEFSETWRGQVQLFSEFAAPTVGADGPPSVVRFCRNITGQRAAERAGQGAAQTLGNLLANLPGIAYRFRLEPGWPFEYLSAGAAPLTGYPPEQLAGASGPRFQELVVPDDRERRADEIQRAVQEGRPFRSTYRLQSRTGQMRWLLDQGRAVLGPDGKPVAVEGFATDITARVRAEASLRRSEENYRLLVEHQSELLVKLSGEGHFLFLSPSATDLYGQPEAALLGTDFLALAHAESREGVKAALAGLAAPPHAVRFEERSFTRHGWRWLSWSFRAVLDPSGAVSEAIGVGRDFTAQRAVSEALAESETRFRTLAESTAAAIVILQDGRAVYANPSAERLGGSSAAELSQLAFWEELFPSQPGLALGDAGPGSEPPPVFQAEACLRRRDGSFRWVDLSVAAIRYEGRPAHIVTAFDISGRKQAEAAIRESEGKYRRIFEGVTDGIYLSSVEGRPLLVNPALVRILGFRSAQELLSRDIAKEGYADPGERRRFAELIERDGQVTEFEAHWYRQDRSVVTVVLNSRGIRGPDGRVAFYEGTVRDVTEERRSQDALRESEARYRALFDHSYDAIFLADPDSGALLDANPRAQELIGRSLEEIRGMHQSELHPAEEREHYRRIFTAQQVPSGGQIHHGLLVQHRDGSRIPVDIAGSVFRAGDRRLQMGLFHDIREERRAQEDLLRYKFMLDHSADESYLVRRDGSLLYVNEAAARSLGYTVEELLALGVPGIDPDFGPTFSEHLEALKSEEHPPFETVHLAKDGRRVPKEIRSTFIRIGGEELVYGSARDITARKAAEQALRQSAEQYRLTIDALTDAVHLVDRDLRIQLFNATLQRWVDELGSPGAISGRTVFEVFPFLPERVRAEYEEVFRTGASLMTEDRVVVGGTELYTETRKIAISDETGVVRVLTVIRDVTARHAAERALRDSEARLSKILEQSPIAMALVGMDGTIEYINRKAVETFGYPHEEIPDMDRWWAQAYPDPGYREEVVATWMGLVRKAFEENREIEGREYRVTCKDGSVKTCFIFGVPIADKVFVMFQDITGRWLAEQALRESEAHLRKILEQSPMSMVVVGADNTFEFINRKFTETFGYLPEDVPDMDHWAERAYPDPAYRHKLLTLWARLIDEAKAANREIEGGEYEVACKDGSVKTCFIFGVPIGDKYISMLQDVTARRRAEAAALVYESRLRNVLDRVPVVVFALDPDGRFTFSEGAALAGLGLRPGEVVGRSAFDVYADYEEILENLRLALRGAPRTFTARVGDRVFETWVTPQMGPAGEPTGAFGLAFDATERIRAEERSQQAQRFAQLTIDSLPGVFYLLGVSGQMLRWNSNLEAVSGYSAEEIIRMSPLDFFEEAEKPVVAGAIQQVFSRGYATVEAGLVAKSGQRTPYYFNGKAIELEGKPCLIGMGIDITDRLAAEAALRESEVLHRVVIEQTGHLIYDFDPSTGALKWSGSVEEVTGWPAASFCPRVDDWEALIHPEDRTQALELLGEAMGTLSLYWTEYRLRREDGTYIWVEDRGTFLPGPDGRAARMLGTMADVTVRHRALEALKESESRHRLILEQTGQLVLDLEFGSSRGALQWSGACEAVTGWSADGLPEDLPGLLALVHPEDREDVSERIGEARRALGRLHSEHRMRRRDGSHFWAQVNGLVLPGTEGRPARLLAALADVTVQHDALEEVLRATARLRHLLIASPTVIYSCRPETEFPLTFISDNVRELLHLEPARFLESPSFWTDRIHPDDTPRLTEAASALFRLGSANCRYRFLDGEGIWRWMSDEIRMVRDAAGAPVEAVGSWADVSETVRAEDGLRESEERFRKLFEQSQIGIAILSPDGRFEKVNASFCRMLEFTEEELRQRTFAEITHPDHVAQDLEGVGRIMRGETAFYRTQKRYLRKSGGVVWANVTASVVRTREGSPRYTVAMVDDITEQRRAEEQLLAQNRQFSALIASTQAMTGFLDLEASARAICEAAIAAFGLRMAWIGLVVPESTEVQVLASAGHDEGYTAQLRVRWDESQRAQGPTGRCIKTRKPALSRTSDAAFAPWRQAAEQRGYAVSCALPLIHRDAVRGALSLYSANPDTFTPEAVETLQIFARQCTMVIVNAALYAEAKRTVQELLDRSRE